ncbi:MAG: ABC transporter ATP-binding protein [Bryobacterales bacterium]|nr:ABC transporter ATP-binding protein [Bryobacterales bacterium]
MSHAAVEFNGVWKKFSRGERHDSLRDLIPSLAQSVLGRKKQAELKEAEFWALHDVSFQLEPGDAMAIIGPNGSGKSTALKLLSGILRPDRGGVRVRGRLGTLIELGAGFHPDLTGRENIYLNGTILGMRREEIDRKFDDIVDFSELRDFLDTPVKRYSSGMFARLGFSVAAHVNPEVLVVDEVLSVGDYHFQQRCYDRMREFIRNGTSVIFVSHSMPAVTGLCKRALLLRRGEPLFLGDTTTAIQKYHSLHAEESKESDIEILSASVADAADEEREVFQPGERVTVDIRFRALRPVPKSHAALLIRTVDGQFVFDTATSKLIENSFIKMDEGETAHVRFSVDMNLRSGVFELGFTLTSEIEIVDKFIYYNGALKRVVMVGDRLANGFTYMNPSATLRVGGK